MTTARRASDKLHTCPGCHRPETARGTNYCLPCQRDYRALRREKRRAVSRPA